MFTLTFSVSKPLQFLTSALTPGGEGGHLFRLTCSMCCGEGRELQANITGVCVGSVHRAWATRGLPPLTACVLSWSTLLRLQVAMQGISLKQRLGCRHFPGPSSLCSGSRILHKAQTRLGLHFVPYSDLSSSGDQMLGECTLPRWAGASYNLPGPGHSFSQVQSRSMVSGVPCVSPG